MYNLAELYKNIYDDIHSEIYWDVGGEIWWTVGDEIRYVIRQHVDDPIVSDILEEMLDGYDHIRSYSVLMGQSTLVMNGLGAIAKYGDIPIGRVTKMNDDGTCEVEINQVLLEVGDE